MEMTRQWKAIAGSDEAMVDTLVQAARLEGYGMNSDNVFEMSCVDGAVRTKDVVARIFPPRGHVRCSVLYSRVAGGDGPWRESTSFPVLSSGIPNRMRIGSVRPSVNPAVGCIEAQTLSGRSINFFEPMYWGNHSDYQPGADCVVKLAGLAMDLRRVPMKRFTCEERSLASAGSIFPMAAGPSDDYGGEREASRVAISQEGGSGGGVLSDVVYCRTIVMGLAWFDFAGVRMCSMLVALDPSSGSDPVWFVLYVSAQVLNGYIPTLGDQIEAMVWMQGYLASLPLIDDPPSAEDFYLGQEDAAEAFACAWNLADLRALAPVVADNVQFDSPGKGIFRNGKVEVLGYLQATIEDYAINRLTAYAEMGTFVGEQAGRPCALLSVNDPNQAIGVMEFEVNEGCIERIRVTWGSCDSVAAATCRTGRYPR